MEHVVPGTGAGATFSGNAKKGWGSSNTNHGAYDSMVCVESEPLGLLLLGKMSAAAVIEKEVKRHHAKNGSASGIGI